MKEFSYLKHKLLAEQVRDQIYQYILDTPIKVGEKLPNEFQLCEKFGVGRSTIREAVKLLVSSGILEVKRGSGTFVVSTVPVDLDPLGLSEIEDKKKLAMDIVNVRIMLEPGIAELAAINATEENVKKLRQLCSAIEKKIEKGENYVKDDVAFHMCVAECSQNKVVEQLIPIIDTSVMMFINVTHNKLTDETIMTHRAITEAIAEHDVVGARLAMMMHITFNRNLIKSIIETEKKE
jgi:DNA-binding FadR family transcriptional regulator